MEPTGRSPPGGGGGARLPRLPAWCGMKGPVSPLCPTCRCALRSDGGRLRCVGCGSVFELDEGIPVLLPRSIEPFKRGEIEYHDAVHESFDGLHDMDSRRVAESKRGYHHRLAALPRGSVVLDCACGTGWDAARLAERGLALCLGDISQAMVKRARRRLREGGLRGGEGGRARCFVFDAESIPFPDGSFDAVLITAALHHMRSPESCLGEMARVCRPGGTVVIGFEPNAWPYRTVLPARRALSIAEKALRAFIRSPLGALRKARSVRRSPGALLEVPGSGAGPHSPGDRRTGGFGRRRLLRLIRQAGLVPVSITPVWYLSGFIQEFAALGRLRAPSARTEDLVIRVDRLLSRVPIVRRANWHWNVIAEKQFAGRCA
ncbi:MAG: methyltransferase domain-containing protein [bacterium]|nr:methyltransferase domain-containing protein [bacterium]